MTKRWSEIRALRPMSDEARARAHVENLAEDFGMALSQLRRGEDLTQVEVAHRLLVTQPTVSEIERTGSPSVPTVRRYVEALGARLELVAVFDDGRRIAVDPARPQSATDARPNERLGTDVSSHREIGRPTLRVRQEIGMAGKSERTSKPAAAAAAKTLAVKSASKAAKSAAGSALSQRSSTNVTSKPAAAAAAKTLASKSASKAAKSAAGSALSQRPTKRRK